MPPLPSGGQFKIHASTRTVQSCMDASCNQIGIQIIQGGTTIPITVYSDSTSGKRMAYNAQSITSVHANAQQVTSPPLLRPPLALLVGVLAFLTICSRALSECTIISNVYIEN